MKKIMLLLLFTFSAGGFLFADELLQIVAQNSKQDYVIGYALVSDYTAGIVEHKLKDEFLSVELYYADLSAADWNICVSAIHQTAIKSRLSTYIADKSREKIALAGPYYSLLDAKKVLGNYLFLD